MLYEVEKDNREKVATIFKGLNDTLILSCIQGHMGKLFVTEKENIKAAQIVVDIFVFFAGDSDSKDAKELINNLKAESLVIVNDENWKKLIEETYKETAKKFNRYSFIKDFSNLKYEHIKEYLNKIPKGYRLEKVDKAIARSESFHKLSEDFTSQYDSIDDYLNRGVGYCILKDNEVVSCASSYSIYNGGIEIEIDTHIDYRRKGLATIVAAALIIDCLDKGVYPNWDAANLTSVALAEKLGYVLDKPYDTYYINLKDKA